MHTRFNFIDLTCPVHTQETVRCSVEAFSETLPANPPRDSITLVYRLRDVDGSISWLGLRSARRSEYTWMLLLADGSDIVRIDVLFDKQYIAPAMFGPITDKNGKGIDARFTSIWILKWVGEDSDKCPVPPTYEVRAVIQTRKSKFTHSIPSRNVLIISSHI